MLAKKGQLAKKTQLAKNCLKRWGKNTKQSIVNNYGNIFL
jgi:hypothetical protein